MTAEQFRQAQAQLGKTNRELQELFAVSDQTIVNWRQGHTRIPGAVAAALRLMLPRQS